VMAGSCNLLSAAGFEIADGFLDMRECYMPATAGAKGCT
jgi:hypothetical protein